MASLTLKDIPAEIHERLKSSADSNFRSITQEAFARLQLSFDVEEAAATKLHQSWIDQAVASGPARPARKYQWQQIQRRALPRARGHQR
ncbi:MAG TPA: Arc family DNA-binding protein [Dongiaceae bacterium]|nr:Arc family DNA-binding protein [Dongiaceae bacterium]